MSNSVVRDVPGPGRKQRIEQARELCAEALEICDSLNVSPEIGARLQEVLDAFENCPDA
jgi:hypothetical protein